MNNRINLAQQRAAHYWFIDGLAQIAAGLFFVIMAGIFGFWPLIVKTQVSYWVVLAFILAIAIAVRWMIQWIKQHSTYPRTGYAAPISGLNNKRALIAAIGFSLLVLSVNVFLTLQGPSDTDWSPIVSGLIFTFVLGFTGYFSGLRRFYALALVSFVAALAFLYTQVNGMTGAAIHSALNGVILLILGVRDYLIYRQQNPPGVSE